MISHHFGLELQLIDDILAPRHTFSRITMATTIEGYVRVGTLEELKLRG